MSRATIFTFSVSLFENVLSGLGGLSAVLQLGLDRYAWIVCLAVLLNPRWKEHTSMSSFRASSA